MKADVSDLRPHRHTRHTSRTHTPHTQVQAHTPPTHVCTPPQVQAHTPTCTPPTHVCTHTPQHRYRHTHNLHTCANTHHSHRYRHTRRHTNQLHTYHLHTGAHMQINTHTIYTHRHAHIHMPHAHMSTHKFLVRSSGSLGLSGLVPGWKTVEHLQQVQGIMICCFHLLFPLEENNEPVNHN